MRVAFCPSCDAADGRRWASCGSLVPYPGPWGWAEVRVSLALVLWMCEEFGVTVARYGEARVMNTEDTILFGGAADIMVPKLVDGG